MADEFAVPAGWVPANASRSPLRLVNAYAFSKSSTPPVDQWLHFAQLRPVPRNMIALFALICAGSTGGFFATFVQFPEDRIQVLWVLVLCGAGALYFGWTTTMALLSHPTRAGWPHPHGIGIGASGISYRLSGGDSDVPWDAVTAIRATVTNADNRRKANVTVLRVEYAGSHVDISPTVLGVSPLVLYWALVFYWKSPGDRNELGTTVAQQRMDGWLAETGAQAAV
jgi:hypothetical protein